MAHITASVTLPPPLAGSGVSSTEQLDVIDMGSKSNPQTLTKAKRLYYSGKHREALELYLRLAKSGNVQCQAFVGWMYAKGARGVEQDYERAREWLSQAAQSGKADILYLLAVTDHNLHDYEEAIRSYRKAAELGYSAAYYQLGRMHRAGTGLDQNKDKAYELFDEAARRGHLFARREIAVMLMKGYKGLAQVPKGLMLFLRNVMQGALTAAKDPYSERTFD